VKGAKKVDLSRYLGKWYEIASFPAWFSWRCKDTTAEYTDKEKYIEVRNSCDRFNTRTKQKGKAYKTDKNNVLQVSFFAPFKGDYIIEFLEQNYNFVIVGSQKKNYLWILSRDTNIKQVEFDELVGIAKGKGYDVSNLVMTTKVKKVESTPMTDIRTIGGTVPIASRIELAIHAAVPVFSVARPSGIRPPSRKTVRQSTA